METNNISTSNNSNKDSMITQLFQQFIENGGTPKVTEFKKHLNQLINDDIKQLCIRSGKSADGNDWRSKLKTRFSGRGAKWVKVPVDNILLTLDRLDMENFETQDYRTHIQNAGFAWIRFAGPRIAFDNIQAAAFEVRTEGSTIDHPKQLHYIPVTKLDELIQPLNGTPHSLKLEVIAKPETEDSNEADTETTSNDEIITLENDADQIIPETLEDVYDDFMDDDLNDDAFSANV